MILYEITCSHHHCLASDLSVYQMICISSSSRGEGTCRYSCCISEIISLSMAYRCDPISPTISEKPEIPHYSWWGILWISSNLTKKLDGGGDTYTEIHLFLIPRLSCTDISPGSWVRWLVRSSMVQSPPPHSSLSRYRLDPMTEYLVTTSAISSTHHVPMDMKWSQDSAHLVLTTVWEPVRVFLQCSGIFLLQSMSVLALPRQLASWMLQEVS